VDDVGNANLIGAAERAGVERFVFVSALGVGTRAAERAPLIAAKRRTEDRLRASPLREVIVRPDSFQEIWLSPNVGLDWPRGRLVILGRGDAPTAPVAVGDVAEAVVRLALADDPPRLIELGGPQSLTRNDAADAFERAAGRPMRRVHVPRWVLRAATVGLRRVRPDLSSVTGLGLFTDTGPPGPDASAFRMLGIEPRPAVDYIRAQVAGPPGAA
jgi:NADH dehydrogenase